MDSSLERQVPCLNRWSRGARFGYRFSAARTHGVSKLQIHPARLNEGADRITSHCYAGDDSFVPFDMEGVLLMLGCI